jgi:hypothetical protein
MPDLLFIVVQTFQKCNVAPSLAATLHYLQNATLMFSPRLLLNQVTLPHITLVLSPVAPINILSAMAAS